jgi:ribonuclease G
MSLTPTRIVVCRGPGETRAGLFADEVILEIVHVRDAEAQPGAVFAGRVGEKLPAGTDTFVDIGLGPPGLVEGKGAKLISGQLVAVEVLAPARADKGPKLRLSSVPIPAQHTVSGQVLSAPDPVQQWWSRHRATITSVEVEPAGYLVQVRRTLGPSAPVTSATAPAELDEHIESALQHTITLPSGGRVTFESTSALVAVDIDSGPSTLEVANAEAMSAIAHHLRLRQLAGHIVIDLIPTRNRRKFVTQLTEATRADPNQPQVMGLTPSGMIDVVRRRTAPALHEVLCDAHGVLSAETMAFRALRQACAELLARKVATVTVHVAPDVRTVLNERLATALAEAQSSASGTINITSRPDFPRTRIEVS